MEETDCCRFSLMYNVSYVCSNGQAAFYRQGGGSRVRVPKVRICSPNLGFFNFHLGIHSLNKYLPDTYNVYGREIKAVNKA